MNPSSRDVGAQLLHRWFGRGAGPLRAELRIRHVTLMTEREAKVQTGLPGNIQLVIRHIVAEQVATIIGEPQFS